MKKTITMYFLLFFILLNIGVKYSKAQNFDHTTITRCGTAEFVNQKMANDAIYLNDVSEIYRKREEVVNNWKMSSSVTCTASNTVIVPVAVHFASGIGTTAAERACLLSLVNDQIDILNEAFGATGAYAGSTPSCIQYALANMNHPSGSGLNNGDPAVTFNGAYTCPAGSPCTISAWAGYLNIVVQTGTGVLGIAPLGGGLTSNNSVVIEACAFGSLTTCASAGPNASCGAGWPYDLGITVVHEVGHWASLDHTFCQDGGGSPMGLTNCTGCGAATDCDGFSDTPAQCWSVYGCPVSTANNPCTAATDPTVFNNFMDYGDDACLNQFTPQQATAANSHVNSIRGQIKGGVIGVACNSLASGSMTATSTVCSGGTVSVCANVDAMPDPTATVRFSDGTTNVDVALSGTTYNVTTSGSSYNTSALPATLYVGDVLNITASSSHPLATYANPSGANDISQNDVTTTTAFLLDAVGTYSFACTAHATPFDNTFPYQGYTSGMIFTVNVQPRQVCGNFTPTNTTCATTTKNYTAQFVTTTTYSSPSTGILPTCTADAVSGASTTVYPIPQAPAAASIVTSGCNVTITPVCAGTLGAASSPTGGAAIANWNSATNTYTSPAGSAAGTLVITVNGLAGAPASCASTTFNINTPSCGGGPVCAGEVGTIALSTPSSACGAVNTFDVNATGNNTSAGYATYFFLIDGTTVISGSLSTPNTTGTFTNVPVGTYCIYAANVNTADADALAVVTGAPSPLTLTYINNNITQLDSPGTVCGEVSTCTTITVDPIVTPVTSFTLPTSSVCAGSASITPTTGAGFTTGGTWSISPTGTATINASTGVVTIPASVASSTVYTITYSVAALGCNPAGSSSQTLTVNPVLTPITTFTLPSSSVCAGSGSLMPILGAGFVPGGIWTISPSGTATINAATGVVTIPASVVSLTVYTITYSIPAAVCNTAGLTSQSLTVNPVVIPTTSFTLPSLACVGDPAISPTLGAGFTSGGTWTISPTGTATINASTGAITPPASLATSTTYTVTYNVAASGCNPAGSSSQTITINTSGTPNTNFTIPTNACAGSGIINPTPVGTLSGGGTWTIAPAGGPTINAVTGAITPPASIAASTLYTVTYSIAATGCNPASTNSETITIDPSVIPTTNFTIAGTACAGDPIINPTLGAGFTSGGTWTISPTGTATINSATGDVTPPASLATATNYTVTYNVAATGCNPSATFSQDLTISPNTAPNASFALVTNTCAGSPTLFPIAVTSGGVWSVSPAGLTVNPVTGLITVPSSVPSSQIYLVTYTISASGCSPAGTSSQNFVIDPTPVITSATTNCTGGVGTGEITVIASGGASLSYSLDGGATVQASNVFSGLLNGTYIVTVSNGEGCSVNSSSIVVSCGCATTFTADAGSDVAICENENVLLNGTIGGGALVSTWTSSGDGTFDNSSILNPTYTLGSNDITNGNVNITLSTEDPDGVGPCVAATSTITITINPLPVITDVNSICVSTDGEITVTATGGLLEYSIDGILFQASNVFSGLADGTYTITVRNTVTQCSVASAGIIVLCDVSCPPYTANAGVNQTICNTDVVNIVGSIGGGAMSSTWSTSGTGSFDNASSLTAVYTPSAADIATGVITITLTTDDPDGVGPCLATTSSFDVTINNCGSLSVVTDPCNCANGIDITGDGLNDLAQEVITITSTSGTPSVTFLTGNLVDATGAPLTLAGVNLLITNVDATTWTITAYLNANNADIYSLEITAGVDVLAVNGGPCAPCSILCPPYTVSAGTNQTICENGVANVSGSVGGGVASTTWTTSGSGSFDDASLLTAIYTPSALDIALGTVTLTLTTDDPDGIGPCTSATDFIVVSIDNLVNAGMDNNTGAACSTDGTFSGNSLLDPTAASGGTWSTVSASATINPITGVVSFVAAGIVNFSYTVDGGACPYDVADFVLTINDCGTPLTLNDNPSTIGSGVFQDVNGNGVQEPGEPDIAGVTVELWSVGPDGIPGTADDVLIGTTTTDINGNYSFDSASNPAIVPGEYYLHFPTSVVIGGTNVPLTNQNSTAGNENNDSDVSVTSGSSNTFFLIAGDNILPIAAGYASSVVSISLHTFNGKADCKNVNLTWETATENNTSHFQIWKSVDGLSYQLIAATPAAGNSLTLQTYQFTDNQTGFNLAYYRLELHNIDGTSEVMAIIPVEANCEDAVSMLTLYPNPTNDILSVEILSNTTTVVNLEVIDLLGREILKLPSTLNPGVNVIKVPTQSLSNAMYLIGIEDNNFINYNKFVKTDR